MWCTEWPAVLMILTVGETWWRVVRAWSHEAPQAGRCVWLITVEQKLEWFPEFFHHHWCVGKNAQSGAQPSFSKMYICVSRRCEAWRWAFSDVEGTAAGLSESASSKKQNRFYITLVHALAGNKLHSTSSHTLYTPNTCTMRFQFCCECKAPYKC